MDTTLTRSQCLEEWDVFCTRNKEGWREQTPCTNSEGLCAESSRQGSSTEATLPSHLIMVEWPPHMPGKAGLGSPPFSATAHSCGLTRPHGSQHEGEALATRPTLTLPSCACGTSVARGSATSSSWPATGLAGRPPASPLSGPASHTGRALWSSSRNTPRRSRRCWLRAEGHSCLGGLPGRPVLPLTGLSALSHSSRQTTLTPRDRKQRPREGSGPAPGHTAVLLQLDLNPHSFCSK